MSLKEKLNANPALALGGTIGLIACAVVLYLLTGSVGGGDSSSRPDEAFFSVDDGKSWFADSASKVPPFDHEGKAAVRAHVFTVGGKQFVNHLERFTAAGKQFADAAIKNPGTARPSGLILSEVKRPGDAAWVAATDMAKAGPIIRVVPPAGVIGEAVALQP